MNNIVRLFVINYAKVISIPRARVSKSYPIEFVLPVGIRTIIIYQYFCVRERLGHSYEMTFSRLRCEIELLSAILGFNSITPLACPEKAKNDLSVSFAAFLFSLSLIPMTRLRSIAG